MRNESCKAFTLQTLLPQGSLEETSAPVTKAAGFIAHIPVHYLECDPQLCKSAILPMCHYPPAGPSPQARFELHPVSRGIRVQRPAV